ncbi:succinate--CoA ligase subunit alpha [candidate division WOR-1 bacterium RIFCSPHIGHO2_01_FULL_53_15]|uniref:Succinate--CoA ligase [ADP-forming] subunit alpha n=1 Tax=candidate division WOR-1 bacterium RIFCSPHIGHO2_01_FULL_53_15 TaxID=1802564 RepID=A0A1F4Q3P6_UNCSA|nr:MAG: succinate--CoA ligase subunit alpha [candidate division WOR-1 bacterium RIFCSPHIGHO2_01_FULL_53_15]OGC12710.1 MAG: succinate--CoA ligase subunit alpha [candidate division WOR-1 bacterium RIFCSPHIGHO2_02_FULL_53_26]
MSVLVGKDTRVIVQGITGREGLFHAQQMIKFGTQVVAGVTPGKGGQKALGVNVYNKVAEAKKETNANASIIFVPAPFAKSAIIEAVEAGLKFIVTITEGIPFRDMIEVIPLLKEAGARMIGPNCPGITTPFSAKLGVMPGHIFKAGPVGIISRSGTLTYEIIAGLVKIGIGQTTCIGIGGDPILGSTFVELLPDFNADPLTKAVVMIGEIGGSDEEAAAEYIATQMKKPVIAFISGRTAPPGKRMGHAGAIISGGRGTAESKVKALTAAKAPIAETTAEIPAMVKAVL